MKTLLFDAYRPDDPALSCSHWIAERTHEKLGEAAFLISHPGAIRATLEASMSDNEIQGLVAFGHGDGGRVYGAIRHQHHDKPMADETSDAGALYGCDDEPALDRDNLHLLVGRFCHIIGCNVGFLLPDLAIEAGASCFVAYETTLTPEFDVTLLPTTLTTLLSDLATRTTQNLHCGIAEKARLQASVHEAILVLEEWFESEEGGGWRDAQDGYMQVAGLRAFAHQLRREMVVVPRAP